MPINTSVVDDVGTSTKWPREHSTGDQDTIQFLLALYERQAATALHHEEQRATMTNYVLLVAGAALGLVAIETLRFARPFVGIFLVCIGIFGASVSAKHYERNRYHSRLAGKYRAAMEELDLGLRVDRDAVRAQQAAEFPWLYPYHLWKFWVALHVMVAILGALVAMATLWLQ